MDIGAILFSFEGRINRLKFWIASSLVNSGLIVVLVSAVMLIGKSFANQTTDWLGVGFGSGGLLIAGWIHLALGIKRFHDSETPLWVLWLFMLPGFGTLILWSMMSTFPSHRGINKHGSYPIDEYHNLDVWHLYFGFSGRINRSSWWFASACMWIGLILLISSSTFFVWGLAYVAGYTLTMNHIQQVMTGFLLTLFAPIKIWSSLALGSKRLHDINESGWWQGLHFIPVMGTLLMILSSGFLPSNKGANRFGGLLTQS